MNIEPQKLTNAEFVNTFLRMAHEPHIAQEHLEVAGLTTDRHYGLKWQIKVREVFYNNQPFNRLRPCTQSDCSL